MGRRYKRKSRSSSIIKDLMDILANSSWYATLIWGSVFFFILYFLIPLWLQAHINASSGNKFSLAVELSLGRRIHWIQWIGIALALIALYFSVRNYFLPTRAERNEKTLVGILARMISRRID